MLILAAVAAIVAISIPIHLYIEKPLLRFLNEKTNFT
jgi:peptidoglycan/LPS O-acetylase OafA/YrhL